MTASEPLFMVGSIARAVMCSILVHSGVAALRDFRTHAQIVSAYQLLPTAAIPFVAGALPILSILCGLGLLLTSTVRLAAALGVLLMVIFTGAASINLARGRSYIDCGCGGATGQHLSLGLVARNMVLLLLLSSALTSPIAGPVDASFVAGVAGGSAWLVVFYIATNQLLLNVQMMKQRITRGQP